MTVDSSLTATMPASFAIKRQEDAEIRVSGRSNVHDIAHGICGETDRGKRVTLVAIGTAAVNQAVKSIVAANGRKAGQGVVFTTLPAMQDIVIDDEAGNRVERTCVKLLLTPYTF